MKAIVVEDSQLAREGLVSMLVNFPEIELLGEASHSSSALALIEKVRPELLFLDIHMPGESGLDMLAKIDYTPKIIFTTAYAEYAINSFEYHTVDYLLKPITQVRLAQAISKLDTAATAPNNKAKPQKLAPQHRVLLKHAEQCHLVELKNILYFESCKNYVSVHFDNKQAYLKRSLNAIEQRLPEDLFLRANRGFIVNIQHIKHIDEWFDGGYLLTMKDGKEIKLSRSQASRLKQLNSL